jgi:hypothetical protein
MQIVCRQQGLVPLHLQLQLHMLLTPFESGRLAKRLTLLENRVVANNMIRGVLLLRDVQSLVLSRHLLIFEHGVGRLGSCLLNLLLVRRDRSIVADVIIARRVEEAAIRGHDSLLVNVHVRVVLVHRAITQVLDRLDL